MDRITSQLTAADVSRVYSYSYICKWHVQSVGQNAVRRARWGVVVDGWVVRSIILQMVMNGFVCLFVSKIKCVYVCIQCTCALFVSAGSFCRVSMSFWTSFSFWMVHGHGQKRRPPSAVVSHAFHVGKQHTDRSSVRYTLTKGGKHMRFLSINEHMQQVITEQQQYSIHTVLQVILIFFSNFCYAPAIQYLASWIWTSVIPLKV